MSPGVFVYLARVCFAVMSVYVVGRTLLRLIDRRGYYQSGVERTALSFGLGFGGIALIQLYLIAAHIPISPGCIGVITGIFWCIFLFPRLRTLRPIRLRAVAEGLLRDRTAGIRVSFIEGALICFLGWLCLVMFVTCLGLPKFAWDARAVWGLTAKIFYYEHTIFTKDFLDTFRYHPAPFYPIGMPLVENFFYKILGAFDEYFVKVIYALFYGIWIMVIYRAQRVLFSSGRIPALIGTAVGACVPCFFLVTSGSVPSAYVDFPLGCLFTFGMVYLFRYLLGRRKEDLWVSSLFLAFCLFFKNEGIPLFMIAVGVFVVDLFIRGEYRQKRSWRAVCVLVGFPLLLLIPWVLIRNSLAAQPDFQSPWVRSMVNFTGQIYLIPKILKLTVIHMFTKNKSWSLFWHIFMVSLFLFPNRFKNAAQKRVCIYLLLVPIIYYFFVITPVYMSLPLSLPIPIEVEFEGASFERLRMHALGLLVIFLGKIISDCMPRVFAQKKEEQHGLSRDRKCQA